ncbi:hypothetical protein CGMCC3_g2000 [Colletotrichum fructicola]|nr:uncharacterized protein CGMCC3_g2000 [Colletotrichum fructicola]KAE9581794.1 hypothetical protein CGMCC3_g2000 [Colletotrichum fructicola]
MQYVPIQAFKGARKSITLVGWTNTTPQSTTACQVAFLRPPLFSQSQELLVHCTVVWNHAPVAIVSGTPSSQVHDLRDRPSPPGGAGLQRAGGSPLATKETGNKETAHEQNTNGVGPQKHGPR